MTLQSSGAITINQIKAEMNTSSTSLRTLSSLAGFSTPDRMSEFYGFSNYYRPNLIAYTDPFVTSNYSPNITSATIFSSFGGSTRSSNFSLQYSDNNVNWFNAGGGVMSNNSSCGIITVTANSGQFGSHRYWRYVEGSAIVGHHPRTARITLGDNLGRSWTINRYAGDNCSDLGAFQIGTVSFDFSNSIPDLTSITSGASCRFNNISWDSNGYLNQFGGGNEYGYYGNLGTFPMYGAIQFWFYARNVTNFDNYFCTHLNQGNRGIRFELSSDGTSSVIIGNDSENLNVFGLGGISANTWYNIAITWNRATNGVRVYKNNSLVVNSSTGNWASQLADVASGIGFGLSSDRNLNGLFGPLFIYNTELTANQVQQNWITHKARYGY